MLALSFRIFAYYITYSMIQTDREILRLAVPSIVSNITVPLLGLVDLAIVGHLGSARYVAAISVGSMIFNLIYWLMGFLRMGTSGMTSQALGRRDYRAVRKLLARSVSIAMAIAVVLLLFQLPLGWMALELIHPSVQVWPLARTYFDIVIWGAPAMLGLYSLNGWFVGMQTTKIPMTVAIFQNVVNVAASLGFVYGMGMKIEGVAMGTLVAQWSGLLMAAMLLRRKLKTLPATGTADGTEKMLSWRSFFMVNRDIFLRTLCLVSVNLCFTSAGARQGDMVLAVNTLLLTFYTLMSYVMDGFAFAGEAMAGKAYGAGNHSGLRQLINRLLRHWGGWMCVAFLLIYVLLSRPFLGVLTDNGEVIAASGEYLFWVWLIPIAGVAAFIYDGIFIGMTATRGMLVSSAVSTAAFFAILLIGEGARNLWAAVPINHILWLAFIVYLGMRGAMQKVYLRRKFGL